MQDDAVLLCFGDVAPQIGAGRQRPGTGPQRQVIFHAAFDKGHRAKLRNRIRARSDSVEGQVPYAESLAGGQQAGPERRIIGNIWQQPDVETAGEPPFLVGSETCLHGFVTLPQPQQTGSESPRFHAAHHGGSDEEVLRLPVSECLNEGLVGREQQVEAKLHYGWSLRDSSRVFASIMNLHAQLSNCIRQ